MAQQEFSIPSLMNRLGTEADAYQLLEELRWGADKADVVCPHCGVIGGHYFLTPANGSSRATRMTAKNGKVSERRVWKCCSCRKQFSVLTGTIFHGTKISVRTWVMVVLEMCASKNGVSAREIERKYDLTAKTAWYMLHRIREAMKQDPMAGLLRGTIIADETFIGGKPKNRHADDPRQRGAGFSDKQPVLALVDFETREVRSRAIPDVTAETLRDEITPQVDIEHSQLWTDELRAYRRIGEKFNSHHTVNHKDGQYKNRGATTNTVEGYFSQLKRSLDGTHHHVSVEHLNRYLAQFDFMYTNCKATDSERMVRLIDNVAGRRLSYKPLTGQA
ncbi:MAG: IS1595 family transposase [Frankiaceae bacterium]|nr:IS1595 family transposase [Frankiaceae bacterium]